MSESKTFTPDPALTTQSYTTPAGDERDSARIMMLGGLAAGVVGGLIVLLSEREKEEPQTRLEQARQAIEEAAAKAKVEGKKTSSDVASSLMGVRDDASTKGKKLRKDAKRREAGLSKKSRKDAEEAMAKITGLLEAARVEAGDKYKDVKKQAPDVHKLANELQARTDDAASDAKKRGEKLRKQAGKDAQAAKSEFSSLLESLKDKAADVEKVAESYVESALLPKLKDLEKEAATMLGTGVDRAISKSHDVKKQAEKELIPQAKEQAEKIRKVTQEDIVPDAREGVERLKVTLGEGAHVAAENIEKMSADSAKRLEEAKEQVGKQAKDAGDSVKRGGRETRSLLVWLGLAGTIVYSVFLNDEQQKKVKELGMELFGEAKDMYADMKGDSESLSA